MKGVSWKDCDASLGRPIRLVAGAVLDQNGRELPDELASYLTTQSGLVLTLFFTHSGHIDPRQYSGPPEKCYRGEREVEWKPVSAFLRWRIGKVTTTLPAAP